MKHLFVAVLADANSALFQDCLVLRRRRRRFTEEAITQYESVRTIGSNAHFLHQLDIDVSTRAHTPISTTP